MTKDNANSLVYFYQADKPVSVKYGEHTRTLFRLPDIAMAEQDSGAAQQAALVSTDDKGSILHVQNREAGTLHRYTAYGHAAAEESGLGLLGYNGELRQPATGWYLLGNGYRAYNPTTMRFLGPDSLSPFDAGGLNSYAYVAGDPINYTDPDGHFRFFGKYQNFSGNARVVKGTYVYMAKHPERKNRQAITVVTHGKAGAIASEFKNLTADEFVRGVSKAGFKPYEHDIHVIACHSASATSRNGPSFIEQVANQTGRKAFGYEGSVFTIDKFDFKRTASSQVGVSVSVVEKQSSFSRSSDFNYQRREATPQQRIRDPRRAGNRI
ncbi:MULTISPECIES: RHS repeat-associated core domain-containing protein [unclassified Pseudomonas]|uniref:RHS repeat-associated core domain-containing protein n=1 Tax=unclassified Pseudomonas TaxID=196821 RepID=UPI002581064B|nr:MULTISPECIES: RHS repeat-associated core domain-containing protein [unclassified Pseudomonas]